ncbi:unnamed protein product [Caenorhabditis brenneri]
MKTQKSSLVDTATNELQETILGLSYSPGGHYSAHHDSLKFQGEEPEQAHLENGNRMVTFIIAIKKADVGGGTVFPYLHTTVRANPGDA